MPGAHNLIEENGVTRRSFLTLLHSVPQASMGGKIGLKNGRVSVRFRANKMTSITATQARSRLYSLIDEANSSHHPIQITGRRGNAVLISEDDWRAISETLQLSAIPGMVASIKQGMKEPIEDCSEDLDW